MRLKTTLSVLLAACLSATALWASTITQARIVNRDKSGNGTLQITMDGSDKINVCTGVYKAWLIEDGGAVIYALDGGRAYDFHAHVLMRHDELGSGDGDPQLMGRFCEIKEMRVSHSSSGKPALIVYGEQDGTGSPTAAIVHPVRGVVWKKVPARIIDVRRGSLSIAEYAREAGGNPGDKPIRKTSIDLDTVLNRPVLKNR